VSSDDGTLLRAPDARLRAWLRITLAVLAFLVAGALTGSVGLLFDSLAVAIAVAGLSSGIVLVALFVWFARRLDHRPIRSYGLQIDRSWWLDLMVGAAIGVLIALLTFAGLVLGGWMQVTEVFSAGTRQGLWTGLLAGAITYLATGVYEELMFRGYVISNAAEALTRRHPTRKAVLGAVAISTVVFAAVHPIAIFNSAAPIPLVIVFFLLMGAILGLTYAYTGQLALPIGLHITVNLFGNYVFPGMAMPEEAEQMARVFRTTTDGPGWIVGEGGAAMILATALGGVLVWAWLRFRRRPLAVDPTVARDPQPEAASVP
jgi:uncharacterized protein